MRQDGFACMTQRSRLCTLLALLCICVSLGASHARHLMPLSERVDVDTIPDADDGDPRNRATIQELFKTIREAAASESAFPAPVGPPPPQALQFQVVQGARGLEVVPVNSPPIYYGPPPAVEAVVDQPPAPNAPPAPFNSSAPLAPNAPPAPGTPPGAGVSPYPSTPLPPGAPPVPGAPPSGIIGSPTAPSNSSLKNSPPIGSSAPPGTPPSPGTSPSNSVGSPAPPGASRASPPVGSSTPPGTPPSPGTSPSNSVGSPAPPPTSSDGSPPAPANTDSSKTSPPPTSGVPPPAGTQGTDTAAVAPPPKTDQVFGLPPGLPITQEPPALPASQKNPDETLNGDFYNPDGTLRLAPPPSTRRTSTSALDLGVTSGSSSLKGAPLAMVIVSTIAAFALLAGMALSYYLVAGNRIELEGSENSETSAGRSPSGEAPDLAGYPGFVPSERPSARSHSLDGDHNRTTSGRLVSSFLRAMPMAGLFAGSQPGQRPEQFTIYTNDAAEHPVLLNPSELNRINRAAAAVAHIKTLQAAAKSPRRFRGAGPTSIETRTPTNLTMETRSPTHAELPMV